jgi:hypothetical protein
VATIIRVTTSRAKPYRQQLQQPHRVFVPGAARTVAIRQRARIHAFEQRKDHVGVADIDRGASLSFFGDIARVYRWTEPSASRNRIAPSASTQKLAGNRPHPPRTVRTEPSG